MAETPARIEPCGFEDDLPASLVELATDVRVAAADLGRDLHPESARELRGMVRIMNSYYSNLIEGHNTRPRDIEAALEGRADEVADRPLAEEAAAHVRVQDWIDDTPIRDLPEPTSVAFIRELHRRFYETMPEEFRWIEVGEEKHAIVPGGFRAAGEEVRVGRHMPPSADRLPDFMAHFEMRYRGLTSGRMGQVINLPAAHHRLNYIHPFLDGNGRVTQLCRGDPGRAAWAGGDDGAGAGAVPLAWDQQRYCFSL